MENKKVIETIAPIPLDFLKQYFEDKDITFLIDYDNSTLDKERFLTYLSNLEIPCDIKISSDEKFIEIFSAYLTFNQIVDIPLLEHIATNFFLERKKLRTNRFPNYLKMWDKEFKHWEERLDSLPLYGIYTFNFPQAKVYVQNQEKDETDSTEGINFVSLLKHERFFEYYAVKPTKHKYFPKYFNEYMFKGNSLFHYWAKKHNPYYMFNLALISQKLDVDAFGQTMRKEIETMAALDAEYREFLKSNDSSEESKEPLIL
jgi:hypothetical protein